MAAITGHVEAKYEDPETDLARTAKVLGLGGLSGATVNVPTIEASHANLTRLAWLRRRLENALVKRTYSLDVNNDGLLRIVVTPAFRQQEIPWAPFPSDGYDKFKLWGEDNAKMGCPVWDLPAGGIATGGACPGADVGQTISPIGMRTAQLERQGNQFFLKAETPGGLPRSPVIEGLTICSQCYATEGNFVYANNQLREVVVFWWLKSLIQQGRQEEIVAVLVDSMRRLKYPVTRQGILPVRLHSSGDFFSQEYARVWLRVAAEMHKLDPRIHFWAPTRTWAAPGWNRFWAENLKGVPNMSIRASAYNFGDMAPGKLEPGNAAGTTSLYSIESAAPEHLKSRVDSKKVAQPGAAEPRTDFNCQVYADDAVAPSCGAARAPDGQLGCRACWVEKDLRINYTGH